MKRLVVVKITDGYSEWAEPFTVESWIEMRG